MTNTWYNITPTAEGETKAEIYIYDTIGSHDINAKQFVDEIKELQAETIHVRINSPGGSVIDGNAIFNALERHQAKIITHIDGLGASMASVVAMVGDEVHMSDNALLMIHNPWTVSIGDADELRADADLLEKMSDSIINAYSRSQYEKEEIKDLMDKETWFTAQEALEAGLVDHVEKGLRASANEIATLAENSDFVIPTEKQLASLTKQIEAVTKSSKEVSNQLSEKIVENEEINAQLTDAMCALEEWKTGKMEADNKIEELLVLNKASEEKIESQKLEIEEASKVSEQEVSNKASEIVVAMTHEPIADSGDGLHSETDEDLLAKYDSISDRDDRRDFFTANKTKILRAKARINK